MSSGFVELKEMEEGRAGGVAKVKTLSTTVELQRNDIDDISLESNTHEQPQSVFTPPGSSPTFVGGVQSFIKGKQEQLSHFSAQKALHDFHTFSLQEYMDVKRMVFFRAIFGELLVTTLFLFIVCAVGINVMRSGHSDSESLVVGALSTGFASVALIYSFADVSGAHFNPAVTFATMVTGKTSVRKGLAYIVMQLFGSVLSMLLLMAVFPPFLDVSTNQLVSVASQLVIQPAAGVSLFRSFLMETILSFILVYVIFAVAFDTVDSSTQNSALKIINDNGDELDSETTDRKTIGGRNLTIYATNGSSKAGFAPISIGLTLGFLCFIGGSVSGGAFNPARVFGAGLFAWQWDHQWLYWTADFTGAALAGLLQQFFFATRPSKATRANN